MVTTASLVASGFGNTIRKVRGASEGLVSGSSSRRNTGKEFREFQERERQRKSREASEKTAREASERAKRKERFTKQQAVRERARVQAFRVRKSERDEFTKLVRRRGESDSSFSTRKERVIRAAEQTRKQSVQRPNITLASGGIGVSSGRQTIRRPPLKPKSKGSELRTASFGPINIKEPNVGKFITRIGTPVLSFIERPVQKTGAFLERKGASVFSTPAKERVGIFKAGTKLGQESFGTRSTTAATRELFFFPAFLSGSIKGFAGKRSTVTAASAGRAVRAIEVKGATDKAVIRSAADIRFRGSRGAGRIASSTSVLGEKITTIAEVGLARKGSTISAVGEAVTIRRGKRAGEALVTLSEVTARARPAGRASRVRALAFRGELRTPLGPEIISSSVDSAARAVRSRRVTTRNLGLLDTVGESSLSTFKKVLRSGKPERVSSDIIRLRSGSVSRRSSDPTISNVISGPRSLRVERTGVLRGRFRPKNIGVVKLTELGSTSNFGTRARVRTVKGFRGASSTVLAAGEVGLRSELVSVRATALRSIPEKSVRPSKTVLSSKLEKVSVRSRKSELSSAEGVISASRLRSRSASRPKSLSRTLPKSATRSLTDLASITRTRSAIRSLRRTRTVTKQQLRPRTPNLLFDFGGGPPVRGGLGPAILFKSEPKKTRAFSSKRRGREGLFFSPDLTSRALGLTTKVPTGELALRTTGINLRRVPV